jgi:hypothetical protein
MVSGGGWRPAGLNWFLMETTVTGGNKVTTAPPLAGKRETT